MQAMVDLYGTVDVRKVNIPSFHRSYWNQVLLFRDSEESQLWDAFFRKLSKKHWLNLVVSIFFEFHPYLGK